MDPGDVLFLRLSLAFAVELVAILFLAPRISRWWMRKHMSRDFRELVAPQIAELVRAEIALVKVKAPSIEQIREELAIVLRDADARIQKGREEIAAHAAELERRAQELTAQAQTPMRGNVDPVELGRASGEARRDKKSARVETEADLAEQFGEGWIMFKKLMPREATDILDMGDGAVPLVARWINGMRKDKTPATTSTSEATWKPSTGWK